MFSDGRATCSYLRFAGWARTGTDGRGQTGLLSVRFQERKVDPGGLLRPPAEGPLAETEGFEPSVGVIPLRRFTNPTVSATQPRLPDSAERLYPGFAPGSPASHGRLFQPGARPLIPPLNVPATNTNR